MDGTYSLGGLALVGGRLDGDKELLVARSAISSKDNLTVGLWHGYLLFSKSEASWRLDDANICKKKQKLATICNNRIYLPTLFNNRT